MSLWSRMWSHSSLEPNRSHRRALARLTRPQRHELADVIYMLKQLPLPRRAEVVGRLPEWQRQLVERHL